MTNETPLQHAQSSSYRIMSLHYRHFKMACLSVRYLLIVQTEKMPLITTQLMSTLCITLIALFRNKSSNKITICL